MANPGLFVAVGDSGKLSTSPDGETWTARTSEFGSTRIQGVAWSEALGLVVAVGDSGTLTTSPDGETWTLRTSEFGTSTIYGIAWSETVGLFVAVGESGTLATSPDGETWTLRTSGFGSTWIRGIAWSETLGLFVAVGDSGTLTTSPDGETWTLRTSGFGTSSISGVAWCEALGLVVAVGSSGKLATSPNGVTWTLRTSGFGTSTIRGVAWSEALGLVVAVGSSGKLATSPDGETWTLHTSEFGTSTIRGVAWFEAGNTAPNAPTAVAPINSVQVDSDAVVRFEWIPGSDPDDDPPGTDPQSGFDFRYRAGAGSWTTINETSTDHFYDMPADTLPDGATIGWQVRTYDQAGAVSPWSAEQLVTTPPGPSGEPVTFLGSDPAASWVSFTAALDGLPVPAPDPTAMVLTVGEPSNLAVGSQPDGPEWAVWATWDPVPGAVAYLLTNTVEGWAFQSPESFASTSWFSDPTGQEFTIAAISSTGHRTVSPVTAVAQSAAPPPLPPNAPILPEWGVEAQDSQVQLDWGDVVGATSYEVLRNGVVIASPTVSEYLDATAVNGTPYVYRVRAVNAVGPSGWSEARSVTPDGP